MAKVYTIIINGYPRAGKDLFAEYLRAAWNGPSAAISTVDTAKEIAKKYTGWNGGKGPKSRQFLSDLKSLLDEYAGVSLRDVSQCWRKVYERAKETELDGLLIVHCREARQIEMLRSILCARDVYVVFLENDKAKELALRDQTNDSDRKVEETQFDLLVKNNSSKSVLRREANKLVKRLEER